MDLISPGQLLEANKTLRFFGGAALARLLFRWLKFDKLNKGYARFKDLPPQEFLQKTLETIEIRYDVSDEDLENIPGTGPFITVSNHAFGGIDGIILMKIIPSLRPDFKVIVNFLLTRLDPLKPYLLGVNPFEAYKDVKSSFGGLKEAFNHLSAGNPIGIFPAGEVSSFKFNRGEITDKEWQLSMIKLIKKAQVPVVPVYFEGHNGLLFQALGFIHPLLRTVKLPSEMFNKKGKTIRVRIGEPITLKEQDEFDDLRQFNKFLRMRTYALGMAIQHADRKHKVHFSSKDRIVDPVPVEKIEEEITAIRESHLLFTLQSNSVFCAPSGMIPNIMREIGRLREITYRDVGEGTGKKIDIDQYDPYYEQLFIWDESDRKIIGGYRVAKGKDLLNSRGIQGFYIQSLFHIDPQFKPVLNISIELGRSFIVKEYQKKIHSLFLLWKGILYLLLKNPEYRYLLGPVSISNEFSPIAKALMVEFLKANYFNSEFSEYIHPENPFQYRIPRAIPRELFLKYVGKDLARVDKLIQSTDPGFRIPVLMKKYLSVNAEVVAFNVDPKFSNCLDALMILDMFEVPLDTIESLSREINDASIMERFRK